MVYLSLDRCYATTSSSTFRLYNLKINYVVVRAVVVMIWLLHTAVQQMLLNKVANHSDRALLLLWVLNQNGLHNRKRQKGMSYNDCVHKFRIFYPLSHWQTLQVSGRNSIMSKMGHRWLESNLNSCKDSSHLQDERNANEYQSHYNMSRIKNDISTSEQLFFRNKTVLYDHTECLHLVSSNVVIKRKKKAHHNC